MDQNAKEKVRREKTTDFALFLSVMKVKEAYEDVRKRSRFYQSMIDTPLLKSGKKTRYKNLPSTVIIFITKIFISLWRRPVRCLIYLWKSMKMQSGRLRSLKKRMDK